MANITISQLNTIGSELFQDSESFLDLLKDEELDLTIGGGTSSTFWTFATLVPGTQSSTATTITTLY
ncbi:hypothetical protein NSTCB13_00468 [Nostoc sp. DSM 114160]|jgi:hypothetical protein